MRNETLNMIMLQVAKNQGQSMKDVLFWASKYLFAWDEQDKSEESINELIKEGSLHAIKIKTINPDSEEVFLFVGDTIEIITN